MNKSMNVLILLVVVWLSALAQAQTFSILYSFCESQYCADGGLPYAGVIQDASGNLYGTTAYDGGDSSNGVVFELLNTVPPTEITLHTFLSPDGARPLAPVVRDGKGNIYGTTANGGIGYGNIFKIDNSGNETVLYTFTGGSDGCYPWQGLVLALIAGKGAAFGTTSACGPTGNGTIFRLDGTGFTLLYGFAGAPSDGAYPAYGHLTMDKLGNLYGVTSSGGTDNYGVLYKFTNNGLPPTVLHSFSGGFDGCLPLGSVAQDRAGNLYGTTYGFNCSSEGTVWKWNAMTGTEAPLHNFAGGTADGCNPGSGVALDPKGRFFGVTEGCGADNFGTFYELSASGFSLLHSFSNVPDGAVPIGEVLRTATGTLFGTTQGGGTIGQGTIWSYIP